MGRWTIQRIQCPHCHGTRKMDGKPCPYCHGKGFIAKKDKPPRKVARVSEQMAAPGNLVGSSSSIHGTGGVDMVDKPLGKKPISRFIDRWKAKK